MLIKSLKFIFKPTFNWWEIALFPATGQLLFSGQILFALLLIFVVVVVNQLAVKSLQVYDEVKNENK